MHVKRDYVSYSEPERETFSIGLTRVCVRSGSLNLPYSLQGRFAAGSLRATDAASGASYTLEHEPPRSLNGLAEFFETSGLKANDQVILHLEGDRVELEAKRFERRPASQRRSRGATAAAPSSEDLDAETVETTPHGTTIRQRRIRHDDDDGETRPAGSPARTEASAAAGPGASLEPAPSDDAPARASGDGAGAGRSAELGSSWHDDTPTASSWAMAFARSRSRVASEASDRQATVRAVRVSRDGSRVPLREAPAGADAADGRFDATVGMRIAGGATSELAEASADGPAPTAPADADLSGAAPAANDDGFSDTLIDGGPVSGELGSAERDEHEETDADPEGAVKDADAWPRAIQKAVFDVVKRGRDRSRAGASPKREASGGNAGRSSRGDEARTPRGEAARTDDRPPVWRPSAEQGSLWQQGASETGGRNGPTGDRPQGGLFEGRTPEAASQNRPEAVPSMAPNSAPNPAARAASAPTTRGVVGGSTPIVGGADAHGMRASRPAAEATGPRAGTEPGSVPRPAAERTGAPRPAATAQVADHGPAWLEAFEQEGDLYTRLKWALEHPSMPVIVTRDRLAEATEVPHDVLKEILDGFAVESPSERFQIQRIGKDAYRVSRSGQ